MDDSSYKGELGGLLAILSWLTLLESHFPPSQPYTFLIGCDGDSALIQAIDSSREQLSCSWKCFDILTACISTKEALHASLVKTFVKGHADDHVDRQLTLVELLNVRADQIKSNQIRD